MKPGWEVRSLGEVCVKVQDGAHHSPKVIYPSRDEGQFPYVTSKNIRNTGLDLARLGYVDSNFHNTIYPRCNPELGDVLLTKDGANTGNVTLNTLDEPFSLLSSVCLIKPDREKLHPKFLVYYLQSEEGLQAITGKMTGAAIKRIILRTLNLSPIPLPPLEEQKRIVAILDEAFEGLDRACANAEANLAEAQQLFSAITTSAFNHDASHWREVPLGKLAEFRNGLNFTRTSKGQSLKIVGVGDFQKNQQVPIENLSHVVIDGAISDDDCLCAGDILAVRSNGNKALIGRVMITPETDEVVSFSGFTIRIRLVSSDVLPEFLLQFMRTPFARDTLTSGGGGSNISNLNQGQLSRLRIRIPSLEHQRKILEQINAADEAVEQLQRQFRKRSDDLASFRQSLLQKAFSGELT